MLTIKNRRLLSLCVLRASNIRICMIFGTAIFLLVGCGQKGDLYLVDKNAAATEIVQPSDDITDSASRPQDSAFATLRDDKFNNKTP